MFIRARRWPFRIGRDPRNDLCLAESEKVSRLHARIVSEAGQAHLIVTGSNPTFLNGIRIAVGRSQPLNPGDVIELPDYRLEVQDSSGATDNAQSTVMLKAITDDQRLVRQVATRLNLTRWTAAGIHQWLQAHRGRQIMIQQGHYQLCLGDRLDLETLSRRLELFGELLGDADPADVEIEILNQ
jgi:pSer/pThr/pTyr-binding forkhead associated (FHA) protein